MPHGNASAEPVPLEPPVPPPMTHTQGWYGRVQNDLEVAWTKPKLAYYAVTLGLGVRQTRRPSGFSSERPPSSVPEYCTRSVTIASVRGRSVALGSFRMPLRCYIILTAVTSVGAVPGNIYLVGDSYLVKLIFGKTQSCLVLRVTMVSEKR